MVLGMERWTSSVRQESRQALPAPATRGSILPQGLGTGCVERGVPLVTVIMLVFNHEDYLVEALESVIHQRVDFSYEILIGEDCSTDASMQIIDDYRRKYPQLIRVVTAPTNVGPHENHRRLVEASRGRYIAYCEGDDYWNTPDKLVRQVNFLAENPRYGAVHSDFSHIVMTPRGWRARHRIHHDRVGVMPEGSVLPDLLRENFVQTCTLVVRADLARQFMSSELSTAGYSVDDWPLCLYVSAVSEIAYLDDCLATYRRVRGSITNQGLGGDMARVLDHLRMVTDFASHFDIPTGIVHEAESRQMRSLLALSLAMGNFGQARFALGKIDRRSKRYGLSRVERFAAECILSVPGVRAIYLAIRNAREFLTFRVRYRSTPTPPACFERPS